MTQNWKLFTLMSLWKTWKGLIFRGKKITEVGSWKEWTKSRKSDAKTRIFQDEKWIVKRRDIEWFVFLSSSIIKPIAELELSRRCRIGSPSLIKPAKGNGKWKTSHTTADETDTQCSILKYIIKEWQQWSPIP